MLSLRPAVEEQSAQTPPWGRSQMQRGDDRPWAGCQEQGVVSEPRTPEISKKEGHPSGSVVEGNADEQLLFYLHFI